MERTAVAGTDGGDARRRLARRLATSALLIVPSVVAVTAPGAHAATGQRTASFAYTGATQTWTVPDGVHTIDVVVDGGQGAPGEGASAAGSGGSGGAAAEVATTMGTSPGQTLTIYVGQS